MPKSYVPQLIRLLERVCIYITKHRSTMAPYLSAQQLAFLDATVSGCAAAFGGANVNEQP